MKQINIAWVSDIHYKKEYHKTEDFKEYTSIFIDKLVELNDENSIEILIFTGDISFSCHSMEYTFFEEDFLDPLKEVLPKTDIIFIPGNHDVSWDKVKSRLSANIDGKTKFNDRKMQIDPDIFSEYTAFYHRGNTVSDKKGIISKLSDSNTEGYVYFEERKILFLLINSCNLSFGNINKVLDGYELQDLKVGGIKTQVLIGKERIISELGNQTYNLEKFPFTEVNKIIENDSPVVLTLAHHPPNWLHWSELNSEKLHDSKIFYDKLIPSSDMLLVGHEHSTINIGDRIGDKTIMLKAGAFLDLPENGQLSLSNNWFSILKIKPNFCERTPYFYRKDNSSWDNDETQKYQLSQSNYISSKDPGSMAVDSPQPRLISFGIPDVDLTERIKQIISRAKFVDLSGTILQKHGEIIYFLVKNHEKVRIILLNLDCIWEDKTKTDITKSLYDIVKFIDRKDEEEIIISIFDFYSFYMNDENFEEELQNLSTPEQNATGYEIKKLRTIQRMKFHSFKHHFFLNLSEDKVLFERLCDAKITYDMSHMVKFP
jgi:3',5'-cyclic AMP phosphodiesterase CpdA